MQKKTAWAETLTHTHQFHEAGELANAFRQSIEFVVAGIEDSQRKTTHTHRQHWQLVATKHYRNNGNTVLKSTFKP